MWRSWLSRSTVTWLSHSSTFMFSSQSTLLYFNPFDSLGNKALTFRRDIMFGYDLCHCERVLGVNFFSKMALDTVRMLLGVTAKA
jgi:hypothetical protein